MAKVRVKEIVANTGAHKTIRIEIHTSSLGNNYNQHFALVKRVSKDFYIDVDEVLDLYNFFEHNPDSAQVSHNAFPTLIENDGEVIKESDSVRKKRVDVEKPSYLSSDFIIAFKLKKLKAADANLISTEFPLHLRYNSAVNCTETGHYFDLSEKFTRPTVCMKNNENSLESSTQPKDDCHYLGTGWKEVNSMEYSLEGKEFLLTPVGCLEDLELVSSITLFAILLGFIGLSYVTFQSSLKSSKKKDS